MHSSRPGRVRPGTRVTDFDAHATGDESEPQLEVPSPYAAMRHGVGGQLGDDQGDGIGGVRAVRDAPVVQLVSGQAPSEAGAAWGGAEALTEHTYGDRSLGGGRCCHAPNVAGGRRSSPGRRRVRRRSVRGDGLDSTDDGP